jgi:hypothetical protein
MKKLQSLMIAAVLVCSLSAGVRGGDIGTPGYVPPTDPITSNSTGDIGTPGCTAPDTDLSEQEVAGDDYYANSYSSDFMLYMFWTALTLF